MLKYGMYINGQWADADKKIEVINPATREVVGTVPCGGGEQAKLAADAAYEAFRTWSKTTAEERSKLLKKWHQLIEAHTDELARIMTMEQGKPLQEAIGEIRYANQYIEWYAEEAKRIYGETIPASSPHKRMVVLKQPVGVVAAITPWNFPAAMITRKAAPALAAGCAVVVKPSEETPFTALKLAELADEAGIPRGVLNVVTGDPAAIAAEWQRDARVRKLSFTGSTHVGKQLMRGAADTVKKVSLELGGHAPFIVTEHADLEMAVEGAIASKFRNAGQTCVCTNRIYVAAPIADEFTRRLADRTSRLQVGDGMLDTTDIGPLINERAVGKVKAHIADAIAKGGRVVAGGHAAEDRDGYFIKPTVIADATDEMLCMQEETFGPLAPVAVFQSLEEVVRRANESPYGLAAYVYTENIREAVTIAESLEYGIIGVNDGAPSAAQAPFGGLKESGLGREGGHFGIEEYLEVKYISLGI